MLYLFPNPAPPGVEKKAVLTISSVLISSRENEAWLWEEGRKEETRIYVSWACRACARFYGPEPGAFQRIGDKRV